jgi:hypothetical protein
MAASMRLAFGGNTLPNGLLETNLKRLADGDELGGVLKI